MMNFPVQRLHPAGWRFAAMRKKSTQRRGFFFTRTTRYSTHMGIFCRLVAINDLHNFL
ncbi:hypothetical protein LN650_12490 [Klebsiella pneumoniae subsp. pneumoniae]|nr:hypothetical protein [Klebsiella pneumoniae subsp. pneumoniae]